MRGQPAAAVDREEGHPPAPAVAADARRRSGPRRSPRASEVRRLEGDRGAGTQAAQVDAPPATARTGACRWPARPVEPETVATRPIETDPRAETSAGQRAGATGARGRRSHRRGGGGGRGVLPGQGRGGRRRCPPPATTARDGNRDRDAPRPRRPPRRPPRPRPPRPTPTPTSTPDPDRPSTASAAVERATLTLLGDGTLVAVDGVSRGAPPAEARGGARGPLGRLHVPRDRRVEGHVAHPEGRREGHPPRRLHRRDADHPHPALGTKLGRRRGGRVDARERAVAREHFTVLDTPPSSVSGRTVSARFGRTGTLTKETVPETSVAVAPSTGRLFSK